MKTSLKSIAIFVLTFLPTTFLYQVARSGEIADDKDTLLGLWQTILEDKGSKLIFILKIDSTTSDSLECTIHLPEFGMSNLPYGKFIIKQDSIKLPGFDGKIDYDQQVINARFYAVGPQLDIILEKVLEKPDFSIECLEKNADWLFQTDAPIWSSPTIENGCLLFGNDNGEFYSVSIQNRSIKWKFKCDGAIRSKATIVDKNVCFSSDNGFLYLLDAESGNQIWKVDIGHSSSPRIKLTKVANAFDYLCSSPTAYRRKIFIGSKDSCIYAIKISDGSVIWKYKTNDIVRSTPAVDGDKVYVGSWDHFIYALNKDDGKLVWKYDAGNSIQSSPVVVENKIVFGSRASFVIALDKDTGQEQWKTRYWGSWVESSPVLYKDTIYIGSSDFRKICALDPTNGKVVMSTHVEGWAWPTVAVSDKFIFAGSVGTLHYTENMHGRFYAIAKETGKPVWQVKVEENSEQYAYGFGSSPTLWKDWVFVGGLDGKMYGMKLK